MRTGVRLSLPHVSIWEATSDATTRITPSFNDTQRWIRAHPQARFGFLRLDGDSRVTEASVDWASTTPRESKIYSEARPHEYRYKLAPLADNDGTLANVILVL